MKTMTSPHRIRNLDKRMAQLVAHAIAHGCTIERRTKHLALRFPDGELLTIPSSRHGRTDMNFRQELRRRGVEVPR